MIQKLFGTDGIRGRVGTYPFTRSAIAHIGFAISTWAVETYGAGVHILLGHDTRISAAWLKATLKSGLLLNPISLYDAATLSTPGISKLVHSQSSFDVGIILSASHNSFEDNGIKIVTRTGKISAHEESLLTQLINQPIAPTYNQFAIEHTYDQATQKYCSLVSSLFCPTFLEGTTLVIDCAHGATSHFAHHLFSSLGAHVIMLNNNPTGTNINERCGVLFPHTLQQVVVESNAAVGFAFDGDADRVIAVNKQGIIKNGDHLLALLMHHPSYTQYDTIIGTIMTNSALDAYTAQHGKKIVRAPVGDKYVHSYIINHNAILGGEPSGHIIISSYLNSSDGIFAALKVIETMKITGNPEMETFTDYPQAHYNLPITNKRNLEESDISECLRFYESQLIKGKLIVRYSGTEPVLRITVEDTSKEHAEHIVYLLAQTLKKECNI